MQYIMSYDSPLGEILISADEIGVTGLWFCGQKYFGADLEENAQNKETLILKETKNWLDIYFSGNEPKSLPPIHLIGTEFQVKVWNILCKIPYGKTITYGEIANIIAKNRGISHMSSQAVGGAVGHNKISIIVPCHRVIGHNNSLTGYAGGIEKKKKLLELEGVIKSNQIYELS